MRETLYNRACDAEEAGELDLAERLYRDLLNEIPTDADVLRRLAALIGRNGRIDEAAALMRLAAGLEPDSAHNLILLGGLLAHQGRYRDGLRLLDRALEIAPGCPAAHWHRAHCRLVLGDWGAGWEDYRWGVANRHRPVRTPQPEWDGGWFGGTLYLWAEQGLGDTLMSCRFASYSANLAKRFSKQTRIVLEAPLELVGLLQSLEGVDEVVAAGPGFACRFDYHASLMSLPGILGIRPTSRMGQAYLKPLGAVELPPGKHVGICWRGSSKHPNDRNRSTKLEQWAPILDVASGVFHSLCPEGAGELQQSGWAVQDVTARLADWLQTAALVSALDLVITVDTAVAHLAGALGKEVWILIPYVPDFRWLLEGERTCWYDSARLFRQRAPGDWEPVIHRVADELKRRFS